MQRIKNLFIKHPNEHNMTYIQHMIFSLVLSTQFCVASIKASIHAFCPFLCVTSSHDYADVILKTIEKKRHY